MHAALCCGHRAALCRDAQLVQRAHEVDERLLLARASTLLCEAAQLQRPLRHLSGQVVQKLGTCSRKSGLPPALLTPAWPELRSCHETQPSSVRCPTMARSQPVPWTKA